MKHNPVSRLLAVCALAILSFTAVAQARPTDLQAVKSVRPAFEAFYATLSVEQKAQLSSDRGRQGRFWRWRDRW